MMSGLQAAQIPFVDPPPALPSVLQIEPVGQCNLRCRMCTYTYRYDSPATGRPAFMRYDHFISIMEQYTHLQEMH